MECGEKSAQRSPVSISELCDQWLSLRWPDRQTGNEHMFVETARRCFRLLGHHVNNVSLSSWSIIILVVVVIVIFTLKPTTGCTCKIKVNDSLLSPFCWFVCFVCLNENTFYFFHIWTLSNCVPQINHEKWNRCTCRWLSLLMHTRKLIITELITVKTIY